MTAASRGPQLYSIFSGTDEVFGRRRREAFVFSVLGQAAMIGVFVYLTSCVIRKSPNIASQFPKLRDLPLIFSGNNGGGGGGREQLAASHGNMPRSSLATQIVPPTVVVPKEPPKLALEQTVLVAPDVKMSQGGQIGDPSSQISRWLSNGPGGPGGIGSGCCYGIGPSSGPGVGDGPPGIFPAGRGGISVPEPIFSPEPSFSDEARKTKAQGIVLLQLVVGKDGRPYDIRVRQSLGMGLDEKAIEAVSRWRFRPATLNGKPVATQVTIQVDFHLY